MSAEKVLITGASGFVGSNAVRYYAEQGLQVAATVSPTTPEDTVNSIERIIGRGNVLRIDLSQNTIPNRDFFEADIYIHLAGLDGSSTYKGKNSDLIYRTNTAINTSIIGLARYFDPKIVLVSTSDLYPVRCEHIDESSPLQVDNGYKLSKLELENVAREEGLTKVVVVRPGNIYGPGEKIGDVDRTRFVTSVVANALEGTSVVVWGDGTHARSYLYVDDFLGIVDSLLDKNYFGSAINVASRQPISTRELITVVSALIGTEIDVIYDVSRQGSNRIFDTARLEQIIGQFSETPMEVGLDRVIRYCKKNLNIR